MLRQMISARTAFGSAFLLGALLLPTPAQANSNKHGNFHRLLRLPRVPPAPVRPAAVWKSPIPPPIPHKLLVYPRPPALQALVDFRRAEILAIYYRRSLTRGGLAGGVIFGPDGTPVTPVLPINIFTYFPVFRVF